MAGRGVTITAVRIGDVGTDDPDLQPLLKTQTDREIALQEQLTFQEQERAAEQKKRLTRTEQEAEEERRLATASYEVKIAEQAKEQRLIKAAAEAEAIRIEADGRAEAFRLVAAEIGSGNAALAEPVDERRGDRQRDDQAERSRQEHVQRVRGVHVQDRARVLRTQDAQDDPHRGGDRSQQQHHQVLGAHARLGDAYTFGRRAEQAALGPHADAGQHAFDHRR